MAHYSRVCFCLCLAIMVACACSMSALAAVTVDFIAQPGQRFVTDANGAPLREGTVQVGTFAVGFDPTVAGLTKEQLQSAWTEFGRTEIRAIAGQNGRFSDSKSGDGTGLSGHRIYWWITSSGGEAYAVFSSDDSHWRIPTEGTPPPANATLISSNEVNQVIGEGTIKPDTLQLDGFIGSSPYDAWVNTEFPPGADVSLTGPTVDADADGWSNAFEFLMGTGPLARGEYPVLEIVARGASTELTFPKGATAITGDFSYQFSDDMIDWKTAVPAKVEISDANQTLKATFSKASAGRARFYRIVPNL
ncbi:MAG: hypothetical protein R3F19_14575 [Verrucomicrobiales bacterium]